jgi:hypothetical protein
MLSSFFPFGNTLGRKVGGPQSQYGYGGKEKIIVPAKSSTPIILLTELSQFI